MATPRTIPRNEDLAIVTVSTIGEMPFSELRLVILNLLVDRFGLQVRDLQKCPFDRGQGFVRLVRVTDRDSLVSHSHHHFQGLTFDVETLVFFWQVNRGLRICKCHRDQQQPINPEYHLHRRGETIKKEFFFVTRDIFKPLAYFLRLHIRNKERNETSLRIMWKKKFDLAFPKAKKNLF